jgi:hypothetical protein
MPPHDSDQVLQLAFDPATGSLRVLVEGIVIGDIAIGGVEIKDADADVRAKVAAGNTMAVADKALATVDPNVLAELVTLAGAKTLNDIVTALGFTKGAGNVDAGTLRAVLAADGPTVAALGTTADAAVADANGTINAHLRSIASKFPAAAVLADGVSLPTTHIVGAVDMLYKGNVTGTLEPRRTPTTTKYVPSTGGGSWNVWTPASGKKFRCLGGVISLSANAAQASAGIVEFEIRQTATSIGIGVSTFIPAAAKTDTPGGWIWPFLFPGNGYLSTAADAILRGFTSGAGLTTGEWGVSVWGCEE